MVIRRFLALAVLSALLMPAVMFAHTRTTRSSRGPQLKKQKHLRSRRSRVRSGRRARYSRVIRWTPLKGSHESLVRQNEMIDTDNLERIENSEQLEALVLSNQLVDLPDAGPVRVASNLPEDRRYCRPWTRTFLLDMGEKYYGQFRNPVQVTSAVRTVEFQHKLKRRNGNAAPESGETASPHLSGATIDIAKHGMNKAQIKWTRDYLLELQHNGMVDVAEEFRQSVFHITVYRNFETANAAEVREAAPQVAGIKEQR